MGACYITDGGDGEVIVSNSPENRDKLDRKG